MALHFFPPYLYSTIPCQTKRILFFHSNKKILEHDKLQMESQKKKKKSNKDTKIKKYASSCFSVVISCNLCSFSSFKRTFSFVFSLFICSFFLFLLFFCPYFFLFCSIRAKFVSVTFLLFLIKFPELDLFLFLFFFIYFSFFFLQKGVLLQQNPIN